MSRKIFEPLHPMEQQKAREDRRARLLKRVKAPKRVLAVNPTDIKTAYMAILACNPIRFERVLKAHPQELAEVLQGWTDKEQTHCVIMREPERPGAYFRALYGEHKGRFISNRMVEAISRYRQAWHAPFFYTSVHSIAYHFFERRWPVDRDALYDRLRSELKVHYGSGEYFPKRATLPLAAALTHARAWRGGEIRAHTEWR